MRRRSLIGAAALAALVACSPAEETEVAESSSYITCDDVITWRPDYAEIGEGVTYDTSVPPALFDPDPTPWIGQLRCPPPPGYEYDDQLVVINLYWQADPPPDAGWPPTPDAQPYVDAARPDAYVDAHVDANVDARADGPLPDAAVVDAGGPGDAGGGGAVDADVLTRDAVVVVFAGPPGQGGGKPVQPRPVIPVKPGPAVPQVPLPPGATKPPAKLPIEPQGVKTPAAAAAPRFTNPVAKIAETAKPEFRTQLWNEVTQLDPAFGAKDTQVHMGYWSGNGNKNRDALIKLLDEINTNGGPKARAFFDEGVSPNRLLPAYRVMTAEAWYGRAKLPDGKGSLDGGATKVTDPFPVDFAQANVIWGQYSAQYAQLAIDAHAATGKVVDVWCYIEAAKADRIFYKYELPVLKDLETLGVVRVHAAKKLDAKYTNADDWIHGTANIPPGAP